jgi:hypothetical protein
MFKFITMSEHINAKNLLETEIETPFGTISAMPADHSQLINTNRRARLTNLIFKTEAIELNPNETIKEITIEFGLRVAEVDILYQLLNNFGEYIPVISFITKEPYSNAKGLRDRVSLLEHRLIPTKYTIEKKPRSGNEYRIVYKRKVNLNTEL